MRRAMLFSLAAVAFGAVTGSAHSQDFDAASVFTTKCATCHGTLAPNKAAMAELDLEQFQEKIATHPKLGGVVEGLTEPQIEAMHSYVQEK